MLAGLRAILFDLDGVLIRSEEPWFLAVEEAGRRFRGRPITRAEFAPTFGQGTAADLAAFALRCTAAELDQFYLEAFPRYAEKVWVSPAAAPVLDALRDRGLAVAVVTNTVAPLTKIVLDAAGLAARLDAVVCASEVPRAKPAPDVVLAAMARLGVAAAATWMVGDSRFDRDAAAAAGVRFIGLGLDGDARIEDLGELLVLVP
ncbi:MAG TPA: HAD-IA family hydrolase [Polyangia bacterium]|jgi:phosphoglycolate phosphatase/AHBA synthesis associated protein